MNYNKKFLPYIDFLVPILIFAALVLFCKNELPVMGHGAGFYQIFGAGGCAFFIVLIALIMSPLDIEDQSLLNFSFFLIFNYLISIVLGSFIFITYFSLTDAFEVTHETRLFGLITSIVSLIPYLYICLKKYKILDLRYPNMKKGLFIRFSFYLTILMSVIVEILSPIASEVSFSPSKFIFTFVINVVSRYKLPY